MCLAGVLALPMILLAALGLRAVGIGFFSVGPTTAAAPRRWAAHGLALPALYLLPAVCFALAAARDRPIAAVVGEVAPGMPAESAGLRAGDRIVGVNGVPVRRFTDLRPLLLPGKPNAIGLERGVVEVTTDAQGLLGIKPDMTATLEASAGEVIWAALAGPPRVWRQTLSVFTRSLAEPPPVRVMAAGSERSDWWVMLLAIHFSYAWVLAAAAVAVNALLVARRSSGTRTAAA